MEAEFDPSTVIAKIMAQKSKEDKLDVLFETLFTLSGKSEHAKIDAILSSVDVGSTSPTLLLGYLTATGHCSGILKNRQSFFERCVEQANKDGWNERGMFDGLSGEDRETSFKAGEATELLLGIKNVNKEP